jgi:long-chain fatty acid transport protein
VNNWLSVGAGPRVLWLQGKFSRALTPLAAAPSLTALDVDDIGFGFTAGVTWNPWPATEIALGYRSQVDLNLEGDVQLPVLAPLGALSGGLFNIAGDVKTPDQASLGIRHRITEALTLLGTVEWSNWSNVQTIPFIFQNGPAVGTTATTLTFNYRDGWFFSVGAEYQVTPQHTVRAGIAYEVSPIEDAVRDPILPDNNRWWFSAGLTSKLFNWLTLDFGYSFIWVGDTPVSVTAAHPDFALIQTALAPGAEVLLATSDPYVHIFAASLRFKWTGEPAPVFRKG